MKEKEIWQSIREKLFKVRFFIQPRNTDLKYLWYSSKQKTWNLPMWIPNLQNKVLSGNPVALAICPIKWTSAIFNT